MQTVTGRGRLMASFAVKRTSGDSRFLRGRAVMTMPHASPQSGITGAGQLLFTPGPRLGRAFRDRRQLITRYAEAEPDPQVVVLQRGQWRPVRRGRQRPRPRRHPRHQGPGDRTRPPDNRRDMADVHQRHQVGNAARCPRGHRAFVCPFTEARTKSSPGHRPLVAPPGGQSFHLDSAATSSRNTTPAARPWPPAQSRRSRTPLPGPDSRPPCVRGRRTMTVYSATR